MSPPRVVHLSPWPPTDQRLAELERIFGEPVEVIELSHLDYEPTALIDAIRWVQPAAVVLATSASSHRRAVEALAGDLPLLRPRFERVRNNRGEPEERSAGIGLLREDGEIEALADAALATCGRGEGKP